MTDTNHYTYRVSWSGEDGEHIATVVEFHLFPGFTWTRPRRSGAWSIW